MSNTVLLGDSSSHGNIVTSASNKTKVGGKGLAYVGSTVSGDKLKHSANSIVSSGNSGKTRVGGKPVASSGAMTACGASIPGSGTKTRFG